MLSQAERFAADPVATGQMTKTAGLFQRLAALRGVQATIEVKGGQYHANGVNCGVSVIGLEEWLDAQPGVKPK